MRAVVPAHVIVDHDDHPVKQSDIGSLAIHRTKETDSGPVNLMAIGYMLAASVDVNQSRGGTQDWANTGGVGPLNLRQISRDSPADRPKDAPQAVSI